MHTQIVDHILGQDPARKNVQNLIRNFDKVSVEADCDDE